MGFSPANAQTDVTSSYIKNASLSSLEGWTATNFNTPTQGGTTKDGYATEAYAGWDQLKTTNYSLTQSITLPAGSYTLVNYSFYREGQNSNTDANTSKAELVAGDNKVSIKTLGSITLTKYADNQKEGANVFGAMMYRNALSFTLESEKAIEIGVKGTFSQMRSWCIVGGFQLLDNSKAAASQDVTYLLTNPGFECGMSGWTLEGNTQFGTQNNTSFDNKFGGYYAEKWQSSNAGGLKDGKMSQSLSNLPNGTYRLSAYVYFKGTGAYIQAGDNKTEVTPESSAKYSVTATVTDGTLTIAAGLSNGTSNWVCFDQFTLEYIAPLSVALSEETTYTPEEDDRLANVTLTRTLTQNWNTIVLPFDLTAEQITKAFGEGVKVAEFSGAAVSGDNATLNFTSVSSTKANTPYMIRPAQAGTTYTFDNVTLTKGDGLTASKGGIQFVGNYENSKGLTKGDYFIDASDNTFYRANGAETMKAFRATFRADNASAAKFAISIDGSEPTAINAINAKAQQMDVYSISGTLVRKGAKSLEGLAKGVYIVNGKSYIVK